MVPANGLIVEPGSIEPVTGRTALTACPFLMRFGDRIGSMSAVVDLLSIISVILVVLVFDSRKCWEQGGIHCTRINPGGGMWGPGQPQWGRHHVQAGGRQSWKSPFVPGSKGNHLWALESETNCPKGFGRHRSERGCSPYQAERNRSRGADIACLNQRAAEGRRYRKGME